jgi:tetratricopeptide (TPR) repeat protein
MSAAGKSDRKKTTSSTARNSGDADRHGARIPREAMPLLAALGLFVLLRGMISLLHPVEQRLWGIDFPAWLGAGALPQLALWLPLLFLVPSFARLFIRGGERESAPESTHTSAPTTSARLIGAVLLTAAAGVLAWQVQVAYAFLGDGTWYAAELFRSMSLPDYANSMIKPSAWLTGVLLDAMARTFRPDDIRLPFLLAGIAGMLIAAGAVFFSTLRERVSALLPAVLVFLFGSGSLVFFGYIELYALVYGLSIAYLVTAWQCLRGHVPISVPVLLLTLAMLFGASAAAWLPSLLLLLHWKVRGEEGRLPLRRAAVLLMLLPLAAIAALYMLSGTASDSAYLVAFTPYERVVEGLRTGWQRYVLFAPERWTDILNMLLLGLGPLALLLPVLLALGRRGEVLRRPTVLFTATAAAGGLTLLVFGNTFLGLARDWDVGAFALLGASALAVALWTELARVRAGWMAFVLPGFAAVMISQFLLWMSVNTSEQASAARFEAIAEMDAGLLLPMNTFTAYENLRKFHQSGSDMPAYFRVLRRQIDTGYRSHIGYAEYLSSILKLSDPAARRGEFTWLLESYLAAASREGNADDFRRIDRRDAREFAVRLLLTTAQTGERELTESFESRFRPLFPAWPEAGLLEVLKGTGDAEAETRLIAAAVTEDTRDAFLHMTAGGLYQQRGMYDQAAAAYDAALEREPSMYPSWYLVAAELHRTMTGDTTKYRALLEQLVANAPSSPEAAQARSALSP